MFGIRRHFIVGNTQRACIWQTSASVQPINGHLLFSSRPMHFFGRSNTPTAKCGVGSERSRFWHPSHSSFVCGFFETRKMGSWLALDLRSHDRMPLFHSFAAIPVLYNGRFCKLQLFQPYGAFLDFVHSFNSIFSSQCALSHTVFFFFEIISFRRSFIPFCKFATLVTCHHHTNTYLPRFPFFFFTFSFLWQDLRCHTIIVIKTYVFIHEVYQFIALKSELLKSTFGLIEKRVLKFVVHPLPFTLPLLLSHSCSPLSLCPVICLFILNLNIFLLYSISYLYLKKKDFAIMFIMSYAVWVSQCYTDWHVQ